MRKIILTVSVLVLLTVISCTKKDNRFLITETSIGGLAESTDLDALETVFAQDSIVKDTIKSALNGAAKKIMVFEKGGKPLLQLSPNTDSIPVVDIIQVLDDRYTSDKGISLKSTFKDIQDTYGIKKIVTTMSSVVVFPKGSKLYFTIDKDQLPASLRYNNEKVDAVQIPDEAKIKYLMLGWD